MLEELQEWCILGDSIAMLTGQGDPVDGKPTVGHICPLPPEKKICTRHEEVPAAQICFGDSGGPLIMDEGGFSVVVGVASYLQPPKCSYGDHKCLMNKKCNKEGIAVFTKVQDYNSWIKKVTGEGTK